MYGFLSISGSVQSTSALFESLPPPSRYHYSPQMIDKSDSKGLYLATASILGQPPRWLSQLGLIYCTGLFLRREKLPPLSESHLQYKPTVRCTQRDRLATKTANSMRKLVRDNSPRKLQKLDFDKLTAMGVKEQLTEALLDNFNYDPEAETRLVGALESMQNFAGRDAFIKRAVLVDNKVAASQMRDWAELFAAYHSEVEKGIQQCSYTGQL